MLRLFFLTTLAVLLYDAPLCTAWKWPLTRSGKGDLSSETPNYFPHKETSAGYFLPTVLSSRVERTERAKALWLELQAKSHFSSCWKDAVAALRVRCGVQETEVQYYETVRTRLSFHLAKCDAEGDGRSPMMFQCPHGTESRQCIQGLSDGAYAIFVQYRLHADVLCAYLQEEVFQQRTEAAVASLHDETLTAVEAMTHLQEMEREVLEKAAQGVAMQKTAQEAVEKLHRNVQRMEEQQQNSVDQLLHSSIETEQMLQHIRGELEESTGAALRSVEELRSETSKQQDHLQQFARHLMEELNRVEAAQGALLHGTTATVHWVVLLMGCIVILLATSFPRTSSARLPSACLFILGMWAPLGLRQFPRLSFLANALPWFTVSASSALACLLCSIIFYEPRAARERNLDFYTQRSMFREELQDGLRDSQQEIIALLERSASRNNSFAWSPVSPVFPTEDGEVCRSSSNRVGPPSETLSAAHRGSSKKSRSQKRGSRSSRNST